MSVTPYVPRSSTWETLQKSRNLAAIKTLSSGLVSTNPLLRRQCLRSLLRRDEPETRKVILENWEVLDEEDRNLVHEHSCSFVKAAEAMLRQGTLSERRLAVTVIAELDLTDALEGVLDFVLDRHHALNGQAVSCLLECCQRWGERARQDKDVPSHRGRILNMLYGRLAHYNSHKCRTLIDAWLRVVRWDDALHRRLVSDPRQEAHRALLDRLHDSDHPAVVQLAAGYFWRTAAPQHVIEMLAERQGVELAIELAKSFEGAQLKSLLGRLQELPPLACLKGLGSEPLAVDFEIEQRLWRMLAASSEDLAHVLRGALKLARLGTREAREAAAEVVCGCRRPELSTFIPCLQADAASLRAEEGLTELVEEITTWLNSPSVPLRRAAAHLLRDFTVRNLLDQVRQWPTQMCKAMSRIVALVERDFAEVLSRELQNPAPKRRIAALQVIQLLDCANQVSASLLPMLDDPRLEVRVRTIDLLSALEHDSLHEIALQLMHDTNTDIQDAAQRALRRIQRRQAEAACEQEQTV